MDCSPPGSSVHEILQARVLEWVAISFSRGSSRPSGGTWVSHIASRFFTIWATSEASVPKDRFFSIGNEIGPWQFKNHLWMERESLSPLNRSQLPKTLSKHVDLSHSLISELIALARDSRAAQLSNSCSPRDRIEKKMAASIWNNWQEQEDSGLSGSVACFQKRRKVGSR